MHRIRKAVLAIVLAVAALVGVTASPAAAVSGDAADVALARTYPGWSDYDYSRSDMIVNTTDADIGLFYINDFKFANDTGYGGYIGLQTKYVNCNGTWGVRGVLFTIWNVTGPVTPAGGGGAEVCTGVENGQPYKSIHFPYSWVTGRWYAIVVRRWFDPGLVAFNASATVTDLATNIPTPIGTFYSLPANWSWFNPNTGFSTHRSEEYYPNFYSDCNAIRRSNVTWGSTWMHSIGNGWIAANPTVSQWIYNPNGLTCTNSSTFQSGVNVVQQIGN